MHKQKLSFILLFVFLAVASAAFAQLQPAEKVVSTKLILSVDRLPSVGDFDLAVQATVKKGYHIGAHEKDALYPPSLTLTAPKSVTFDKPVYAKAIRKAFPIAPKMKLPVYEGTFLIKVRGHVAPGAKPGPVTIAAKLETQACQADRCYPPETAESRLTIAVAKPGERVSRVNGDVFAAGSSASAEDHKMADKLADSNIFLRLLMLYGFGLLLAFTPCVYPMIPVTVGYFSGQDKTHTKRVILLAGVYVLGIALTYSALGAAAAATGGVFGAAMQSPSVHLGIAALLVALALSMFGLYEIRPPAFIENRASGRSGVLGALVMGLIFGIVAAPCVGPAVLGLLAYVAQIGNPLIGFALFFVMALGLGTPLFFLAAFSVHMPVPGMWMVAVKKLAGFLLVGAAAYFIEPVVPESIGRLLIPAVLVIGGLYMAFFERTIRSTKASAWAGKLAGLAALIGAVVLLMPDGPSLEWQSYAPDSVAQAVKAGKPSIIDFTAEWCIACGELDRGPFSDPRVIKAGQRFERFQVDGTDRKDRQVIAAIRKHHVQGFPTVIFLDSSGSEVESARITGYVSAKDMLLRMQSVK
jgi:thiol:disulfide interchange protein DsbD